MKGFGSSHTNGSGGKITNNGQKIFYLDNKMDLAEIYKILHNKDNYGSDVAFVLNTDLDFSEANLNYSELNKGLNLTGYVSTGDTFLPIGGDKYDINSAGGKDNFNADFYGNNHKITVGDINYSSNNNVGFFGVIGSSGKVYDLKLEIGDINGKDYVGGFVGDFENGTISNSSVVVNSVKGDSKDVGGNYIGGFVGENKGTISNSSAVVNFVKGNSQDVGGFVGVNGGKIENSSVVVNSVKGNSHIGGFVGWNDSIIENSSAVVNSVSGDNYEVGGFVGENYGGTIKNSSVVVNSVSLINKNVGGFVGGNEGTIENSSAVVNSVSGSNDVGGFVGWNYSTIKNSSAVVNSVKGNSYNVGGFVGYNQHGKILNSVARVLVLNDTSSNVSAGYYTNKNLDGNLINIDKQEFFFGNKKGLYYDGTTLKITVPTRKTFNKLKVPSAFITDNDNWGNTIMTNLSKYWDTMEKKPNLVDFDCKNHKNGSGGKITYNKKTISYEKIFYLDNSNLAKIYEILHNKDNYGSDVAFVLNTDLDFSGAGLNYTSLNKGYDYVGDTFAPIGSESHNFNADFYGNNHKITVGDINYSDEDNIGFFGVIGSSGKVYNLKLEIGNVNGKEKVGGFIGYNDSGTIENSSAIVNNISGSYYVGGFVGVNSGTIENSSVVVDFVNSDNNVGGFVGYNGFGKIGNSSAVVNSVNSNSRIGGFVGVNDNGKIGNSSVIINSVNGNSRIGGFVGENKYGTIENSSVVVNSVNSNSRIGGFVGENKYGTIENSSVVVNSVSGNEDVGGFVGKNNGGTYTNDIARVLVLSGTSSNVSAGYYSYNDIGNYIAGTTNTTNFDKAEFFFGDTITDSKNKVFSYDGTTLTITSPTDTEYNDTNYSNYNNTIMTNLSNYWDTNGWDKKNS